jgi:hypothetical protein
VVGRRHRSASVPAAPGPAPRDSNRGLDTAGPVEERDGMLGSGMEYGLNETYARLDELLARLAGG